MEHDLHWALYYGHSFSEHDMADSYTCLKPAFLDDGTFEALADLVSEAQSQTERPAQCFFTIAIPWTLCRDAPSLPLLRAGSL